MNLFLLYFLLLKASMTSLSGLGSLPMVRHDFVVERHLLTDQQLSNAIVAGRTSPGPYGIYLVCVAYAVRGFPGALAGLLAVITPAFLIIPLMYWLGAHSDTPRVKGAIRAAMLASAALLLNASIPLALQSITGAFTAITAVGCFALLTFTKTESSWLIIASALLGLLAHAFAL